MTIDELNDRLAALRATMIAKGYDEYSRPAIAIDVWARGVVYEPRLYVRVARPGGRQEGNTVSPRHTEHWTLPAALSWLATEIDALPRLIDPREYAPWFETVTP